MELQKYFSMWWDSRKESPFLFYGVIIIMAILFSLIIWLVKIQRRKSKRRKKNEPQILKATQREREVAFCEQKVRADEVDTIQKKVDEEKSEASNEQQPSKPTIAKPLIPTVKIIDIPKSDKPIKKSEKIPELKTEVPKPTEDIFVTKVEIIKAEKEEQSREKYIGYTPINVFAQTEPLNFPYVIMPKANSVIKFPRKGRVGRKGFMEESFKGFVEQYFRNEFQVFDDRFILVKNSKEPYEPDLALVNEKNGINIFLDIEIDEPYEGLNDITKRKATHYQYADTNRNNAFVNRGWIVIRFAEIQVHRDPNACCNFIVDVIKSINGNFMRPTVLNSSMQLKPVKQWTKNEAEEWSRQKYREHYLGITSFGFTSENEILDGIEETELGEKIEEKVIESKPIVLSTGSKEKPVNPKLDLIHKSINSNRYLSFNYQGSPTITKPLKATDKVLNAFCYVKNIERSFSIGEISNLLLKSNYNILRIAGPTIGLEKISNAVNIAISYKRFLRIKYTRASWTNYLTDPETGELILDKIEAEESVRTIMNVQLSINALPEEHVMAYNLNSNYITAYCNLRNAQRTFRFDRIGEIEILDI